MAPGSDFGRVCAASTPLLADVWLSFFIRKHFTCVGTRTSSPRWRSTLCSPSALRPAGPLAYAPRPSSSWSHWRAWSRGSGSCTRTWLWRSLPGTLQRIAVRWTSASFHKGAFTGQVAFPSARRSAELLQDTAHLAAVFIPRDVFSCSLRFFYIYGPVRSV